MKLIRKSEIHITGQLKIASVNINGGSSHKGVNFDGKRAYLAQKATKFALDVLCLQETKRLAGDKPFLPPHRW